MSSTWDSLVDVFSKNDLAAAEANGGALLAAAFGKRSYDELMAIPDYAAAFARVKELKRKVEIIEKRSGPRRD